MKHNGVFQFSAIILFTFVFLMGGCTDRESVSPASTEKNPPIGLTPGLPPPEEGGVYVNFNPFGASLGNVLIGDFKIQKVTVKNEDYATFYGKIKLNSSTSVWRLYDSQTNAANGTNWSSSYTLWLNGFASKDFWIRFQPGATGSSSNYLVVSNSVDLPIGYSGSFYGTGVVFSVTISGPEPRNPSGNCTYTAIVPAGSGSYTYKWYTMSPSTGFQWVLVPGWTSSSVTIAGGCVASPHPENWELLKVQVVDNNNTSRQAEDQANISYPVCEEDPPPEEWPIEQ